MRLSHVLVPALLLTTAFAALAPAAQAQQPILGLVHLCADAAGSCPAEAGEVKLYCVRGETQCAGATACVLYPATVCVVEPCRIVCPGPAAEAATLGGTGLDASGLCVNYAYVADYQWRYLCVDAKGSCPVFERRSNGYVHSDRCLVPEATAQTSLGCVWIGQDMDYTHYACVGDSSCPVYTKRVSSGHTTRSCIVELA